MKPIIAVPATLALVYRAYSHKSLTPAGIAAAALSAIAHAVHPWNLPFALLVVFFLAGTRVTKIKKDVKASLTVASQGTSGGEGPRTHVQVLANSAVASVLSLAHAYQLYKRRELLLTGSTSPAPQGSLCLAWAGDLLPIGIIANYATMAADTFSSELGILATSSPRLITSLTLRKVPRGTNGGVTALGLAAGLLGSIIVVVAAVLFTPLCQPEHDGLLSSGAASPWRPEQRAAVMVALAVWGALGSVLDSVLGALFQRSVRDARTGKIVEGEGGVRVLVSSPTAAGGLAPEQKHTNARAEVKAALLGGEAGDAVETTAPAIASGSAPAHGVDEKTGASSRSRYDAKDRHRRSSFGDDKPSRVVESGLDLLDNNEVNFLTAFTMSTGAMVIAAWYWGLRVEDILVP
ncbi:hypothetical protein GGTG_00428 [Gaeumannomyces tritici R3-111a-1]|uniref:DUF92 domain-containing protein n=1 Tax=Gaeumannomyces tritici (strain R3-111a-1) TaxID=644352 RepID=J3NGN9_GAET3|nr:hypothetical protein GGTG_00428 [Gaeumannomyces tritici R3-111a-1]EJT80429.1 hypothetical protein GGTG_00428 [Gaeumannomyces tritici R3-111a-1]